MGIKDFECECLICGARLDGQSPAARVLHALTEHPAECLTSEGISERLESVTRAFSWLGEKAAEKTLEMLKR